MPGGGVTLSIAAVERDTGISKDTLRVWERRYGFPTPTRDAGGERAYPPDQVGRLRLIKRLLDGGHRPGRVVGRPPLELELLGETLGVAPQRSRATAPGAGAVHALVDLLHANDVPTLRRQLQGQLSRLGVAPFVTQVVAPLNVAVGDAWLRGQLEVHQEHVYTEVLQGVLRQALAGLPEAAAPARPRVLLGTVPGEPHGLGLLMAELLLALDGCACVSLGVQTPLADLLRAAQAHHSDIVALGYTGCTNPNSIVEGLTELRAGLPAAVELWAGGSAPVLQRRPVDGVRPLATLDRLAVETERWRRAGRP